MATYVREFVEAAEPKHVQYTITATATALSSSGILNSKVVPKKLTVKNASGAANACYLGDETVANTPANAGVQLEAGAAYTWNNVAPDKLYIVGTANAANIAYIEAEYGRVD